MVSVQAGPRSFKMALSSRLPSGISSRCSGAASSAAVTARISDARARLTACGSPCTVCTPPSRAGGDCIQFPVAFGGLRHLLCDGVVHQPDDGRTGLVLGKFLQDGLDLGVQPGDRIQKQCQGSQQRRQAQPCPQTRRQRGSTAHRHASFLRIMFASFAYNGFSAFSDYAGTYRSGPICMHKTAPGLSAAGRERFCVYQVL